MTTNRTQGQPMSSTCVVLLGNAFQQPQAARSYDEDDDDNDDLCATLLLSVAGIANRQIHRPDQHLISGVLRTAALRHTPQVTSAPRMTQSFIA